MKRIVALGLFVVLLAGIAGAQVNTLKLARVFAPNMVLQRDQTCPVFGVDVPDTRITVRFAGQTLNTVADKDGSWRVNLEPLALNAASQTLFVTGSTTIACSCRDKSGTRE